MSQPTNWLAHIGNIFCCPLVLLIFQRCPKMVHPAFLPTANKKRECILHVQEISVPVSLYLLLKSDRHPALRSSRMCKLLPGNFSFLPHLQTGCGISNVGSSQL